MNIVLIVIYCLIAAVILFGLTFHDELDAERRRKQIVAKRLIVIDGGRANPRKRA